MAIAFSHVEAKAENAKLVKNYQRVKDVEINALDQSFSTSNEFAKQSSKRLSAQQLFDRAIKKKEGEDYEGAINDLTRVIEQNSSFAPAYNQRGIAKYQLGRYKGAIADFADAMRLNPSDKDYQNNYRSTQTKLSQQANDRQDSNQEEISSEKQASQNCIDLTIMTKLAEIEEGYAGSVKIIKQLKFNACNLGLDLGNSFNYPNGVVAKWSNGGWNYPNGRVAQWSNGGWNYPNGRVAQWSNGGWNYPNGRVAQWSNGGWNYPNGGMAGNVGSLLTYACSNLDEQACNNRLSNFKSMDTFLQELSAIELAWLAYKIEQNQQKKN